MHLLTTVQFAARAGVHEATVRQACQRGILVGVKVGNRWGIPESELESEKWLNRRGPGRPKPVGGTDNGDLVYR